LAVFTAFNILANYKFPLNEALGGKVSSGVAQANKFYEEVANTQIVWFGVLPNDTLLEFDLPNELVSFPVWSSKSRILRLKKLNPDLLSNVEPEGVQWSEFKESFVPLINQKNRVVGINLSGKNLAGIDLSVETLIKQVEAF
jgi:hypothetical protein